MYRLQIIRYFGFAIALYALFGSGSLSATTIHVPADQPTIQAGIDAAVPGDTVLVADGVYTGNGNRDIDFGGKGVVLKSENGPDVTIIDCQGSPSEPHRGFYFHSGEDTTAVVDGFTIQGGYSENGGAIHCSNSSNPTMRDNIISGNIASGGSPGINRGGGIYCLSSSPIISGNTISGNQATGDDGGGIYCGTGSNPIISANTISRNSAIQGGGIYCIRSTPVISANSISENVAIVGGGVNCSINSDATISANTIFGNSAVNNNNGGNYNINGNPSSGGGIFCDQSNPLITANTISGNSATIGSGIHSDNSRLMIVSTIIAFNIGGKAVSSNAELTCCDIFGNAGGDWVGSIANQADSANNFSLDPIFCDRVVGDYTLSKFSPCLAQYSPCGELIGALDLGCFGPIPCADANGDSTVTTDDITFLQTYYAQCGTAPFPLGASDVNCDNIVDIQDIIYLASHLNANGPAPCCQ